MEQRRDSKRQIVEPSEESFEEEQEEDDYFHKNQTLPGLSCCGSFRFFVKHSCRDLLRHKC